MATKVWSKFINGPTISLLPYVFWDTVGSNATRLVFYD